MDILYYYILLNFQKFFTKGQILANLTNLSFALYLNIFIYWNKSLIKNYLYIILLVILFPYVFLTFLLTKTLNILKIEDLKDYLFSIIPMYISFIYMGVLFILVEMYVLHNILSKYPSIITNRINLKTYIYIIIFLTIIFFRKLFNYSIKKIITLTTPKNSNQYKLLIKQFHLLNAYFLISITFIFKSLNFSVYENIFVDALFYSISILTLLDNAHSLAQHL